MVIINTQTIAYSSENPYVFKHVVKYLENKYSKVESSGCFTEISLSDNSGSFFIFHGRGCKAPSSIKEGVNRIAESVSEIINYFKLSDEIRAKEGVLINIGWSLDHEPLIRFINDDETWPTDIFRYIKHKYESSDDRYAAYKERLQQEIIKSKIYLPFINVMEKIGCRMTLSEYFVDGHFFDNYAYSKTTLIKKGVFSKQEVKKDVYPYIKGTIQFDLEQLGAH
jgi:hypothetical protein